MQQLYIKPTGLLVGSELFNSFSDRYLPTVVTVNLYNVVNIQLINHHRESSVTEQVDAMVLGIVVIIPKPTEQIVTMAIPYSISSVITRYWRHPWQSLLTLILSTSNLFMSWCCWCDCNLSIHMVSLSKLFKYDTYIWLILIEGQKCNLCNGLQIIHNKYQWHSLRLHCNSSNCDVESSKIFTPWWLVAQFY